MRIVFKCVKDCEYPDEVQYDPMDDTMRCPCGSYKKGHFTHTEDLVKKANFEDKEE